MKVRLRFPPFGQIERDVLGGASVEMPIELANGATYTLEFALTGVELDVCIGYLSAIQCIMPPLTPEANPLERGDQARLYMMDGGAPSATLEAAQRRKEWAARGVTY